MSASTGQGLSEAKRKLLARMLSGEAGGAGLRGWGEGPAPLTPRPAGTVPPLSIDQVSVWLHGEAVAPAPIYNEPVTLHRLGPLDSALFTRALAEVMRRHEAWRSAVAVTDGRPVLRVEDAPSVPVVFEDLSHLPEAAAEAEAIRLAIADAAAPIDLAVAPLFRVRVVRLGPTRHRVQFTLHHLVFDGVTVHRLLPRELATIYAALAEGRAHDLPEPPVQYGDYALWRDAQRGSAPMRRQLDHWRAVLAGLPDPIRLPTDHPRPARPTHEGAACRFALQPALVARVHALARREGATVYMVMLAAYGALLHRYGGQEDFLVGGITDLRRRPELQGLLGYFLNAVALRLRPRQDLPFAAFLAEVKATLLGALDAAEVPFDEVVREVAPRREAGAHPLFQVLFSIQPPAEAPPPGWDLTQMDVPSQVAKFDLYLEIEERLDGLSGRFIYDRQLFDKDKVARMCGHYATLLESACADPGAPLGRLALLTEAERRGLLDAGADAVAPIPDGTLPARVDALAVSQPEAVAITGAGGSLGYGALRERCVRLAGLLRAAGAGPGTLVAVCAARTPDLIVSLLAVLRTGAAYVPLDPALPRARFVALLEDARPALVLTQVDLLGVLPATEIPLVLLDDLDLAGGRDVELGAAEARIDAGPDELAYVLYTSGSTGAPKGVEITHRALLNLLVGMGRMMGVAAEDVVLATTTVSFDIAAVELFMPLTLGGHVVLASRDDVVDPRRLMALIEGTGCTILQATPAGWRGLLAAGWDGKPGLLVLSGGEAMSRGLARALAARARAVWNGYGPTETTIYSSAHRIRDEEDGPVPIGGPTANTLLYVLDGQGQLLPTGVAGELHIGGVGLARGYRGRPALTTERFVERPGVPGERLYATGDLALRRLDGQFEWLGRIDNQVKVRGYRVELGEVTETLARHPGVAAAAVVDYRDAAGETGLLACVVAGAQATPSAADLRGHLRQTLPDYVVPARYLFVESLPLTPNGKVDRFALLAAAEQAPVPASVGVSLSPAERALAPVWQEVLGVRHADPADNFFELGGHSLLVARLLQAIEARFGQRLAMADIFRAQTMGEVAALLGPSGGARAVVEDTLDQAERRALLGGFESIGEDCEFGLMQRRHGAEPLGLFRFASAPVAAVTRAVAAGLDGIDDPAMLEIGPDPAQPASLVTHRGLGFGYLLFDRLEGADLAALRLREARRLGFLRRKFFEDLAQGDRVWVLKGSDIDLAQAVGLSRVLRARGPARLLWVALADAQHPPGQVSVAEEGLLRGWIDRFAPPTRMQESAETWLEICRNCLALDANRHVVAA